MAIQRNWSKIDFCQAYGITLYTLSVWLEPIKQEIAWKEKGKQLFPPRAVQVIFKHLGEPPK